MTTPAIVSGRSGDMAALAALAATAALGGVSPSRGESVVRVAADIAAAETMTLEFVRNLGRSEWSDRCWRLLVGKGPKIVHCRGVEVPSHRLVPIDGSKYPGHVLREIRARKLNFHGELQR